MYDINQPQNKKKIINKNTILFIISLLLNPTLHHALLL